MTLQNQSKSPMMTFCCGTVVTMSSPCIVIGILCACLTWRRKVDNQSFIKAKIANVSVSSNFDKRGSMFSEVILQ